MLYKVLVPFYRGAVVFKTPTVRCNPSSQFSSPFIEERLYLRKTNIYKLSNKFSSPFIEERLYLKCQLKNQNIQQQSSRPLLSRSGCILSKQGHCIELVKCSRPLLSRSGCIQKVTACLLSIEKVLVPFYRGAVVFNTRIYTSSITSVLVPFYRGAVVFT